MFDHHYTHAILIAAAPSVVWRVLSDLTRIPEWYFPAERVLALDPGPVRIGTQFVLSIRTAAGIALRAPGEILAVEPERLLQWRGHTSGIAATATWRLAPEGEKTRLTHEFAGGGWMMFLSTLSGRAPQTAQKRLSGLKRVVEGG